MYKASYNSANICVQCVVCGLETSIKKSLGIQIVDTCDQSPIHMATCSIPNYDEFSHSHVSPMNNG